MERRNRKSRLVVLALFFMLSATAAVAAETCFEMCHDLAMWFYENPDWGQDPNEFFQMCMDNGCGQT